MFRRARPVATAAARSSPLLRQVRRAAVFPRAGSRGDALHHADDVVNRSLIAHGLAADLAGRIYHDESAGMRDNVGALESARHLNGIQLETPENLVNRVRLAAQESPGIGVGVIPAGVLGHTDGVSRRGSTVTDT